MARRATIENPGVCPYRYDASQYPGGDMRCQLNGYKCKNTDKFPDMCPLEEIPSMTRDE